MMMMRLLAVAAANEILSFRSSFVPFCGALWFYGQKVSTASKKSKPIQDLTPRLQFGNGP
jgi:hypothetical protein